MIFFHILPEKVYFYIFENTLFMKFLTKTQIQELDRRTIAEEGITSLDLMERAAKALSDSICQMFQRPLHFVVFAGPGNNGGDALAVARMLSDHGHQIEVILFNTRNHLSPDCQANAERLLEYSNIAFTEVTSSFTPPTLKKSDIVIDGLFGSGLNKPLEGGYASLVRYLNNSPASIISIDIPSGLMCEDNTSNPPEHIIHATMTLSLQMPKLSFFLPENQPYIGDWFCLDIQLSRKGLEEADSPYRVTTQEDIRPKIKNRPPFAHKGIFGHGLLIAGSRGMAGASILSARAALRSGIGLLSVYAPETNLPILQTSVPEAMVIPDEGNHHIAGAIETDNYRGVAIGPGLGQHEETASALLEQLQTIHQPVIIDADALNILASRKEWLPIIPKGSILTPHPKELERLVGRCSTSYERLTKARELATRLHVNIILKGNWSAVITPNGTCHFNPTGGPGMATAGSGDVLTGILLALLAQGYSPEDASLMAPYLHGVAGDLAADKKGENGMIASDIIDNLPLAWNKLEKNQYLCTDKEMKCY